MRNASDGIVGKIKSTFCVQKFLFFENLAIYYEITWKIISSSQQATDENTIRRMRIACVVTKATYAQSEYVILNCFSTATVVTHERLNFTFIRKLPLLLYCGIWP